MELIIQYNRHPKAIQASVTLLKRHLWEESGVNPLVLRRIDNTPYWVVVVTEEEHWEFILSVHQFLQGGNSQVIVYTHYSEIPEHIHRIATRADDLEGSQLS